MLSFAAALKPGSKVTSYVGGAMHGKFTVIFPNSELLRMNAHARARPPGS